jgi:hypothetical protein
VSHLERTIRVMVAAVSPFDSRLEEIVRRRREIDAFEAEWFALVGEYDRSGTPTSPTSNSCAVTTTAKRTPAIRHDASNLARAHSGAMARSLPIRAFSTR